MRDSPGERGRALVAFLGPSLPASVARRIVPDVVLLPPVCRGDLTSAVLNLSPRAVLIVDGEFSQALSVWHKEVLHAPTRPAREPLVQPFFHYTFAAEEPG